jgi:hypothetical protein
MYRSGYLLASGLLLIATILAGCKSTSTIDPPPPPPSREKLVGTWIAISSFRAYRLDLLADGSGTLATGCRLEPGVVRHYKTDRWQLDGHNFFAKFTPLDDRLEPVFVRARAAASETVMLQHVSISLSETVFPEVADEFTREERVKDWLRLLNSPAQ